MLYSAYGLTVQSDFELPELRPILPDGPADVDVISGKVPSKLPGARYLEPWISISGRDVLYVIPGVVRLLVQDGYRVVVDLENGARESDMRTYLIGSGLGTILHQRALLPLHISAVLSPHGAIAFTGPPGVGKSTMAARINAETGWPIISDDVAVLDISDNRPRIQSDIQRCRLWKDALDNLGISTDGLTPDLHRTDKYALLQPNMFVFGKQPLLALVELNSSPEGGEMTPLRGLERCLTTIRAIYRPFLVRHLQDEADILKKISIASEMISVYRAGNLRQEKARNIVNRVLF